MNESAATPTKEIICPATRDSAIRPLFIGVGVLAFGIWCMTDQREHVPFSMKNINSWSTWALNFYGAIVCPILGVISLIWGFLVLRRKLIADDQGIGFVGKPKISWSDVTGVDASALQDKQILYLLHGQGDKLMLDGYKLKNFKELIAIVESHAPGAGEQRAPAPEPPAEEAGQDS